MLGRRPRGHEVTNAGHQQGGRSGTRRFPRALIWRCCETGRLRGEQDDGLKKTDRPPNEQGTSERPA